MHDLQSPRVNSARLPQFVDKTVRLPCKVLSRHPGGALVEACDGGQVNIQTTDTEQLAGTFVEIVGRVVNESTVKSLKCLNFDSEQEFDMKLVNDVVELTFDPRFAKIFPS